MNLSLAYLLIVSLVSVLAAYGRPILSSPTGGVTGAVNPVGGESAFTVTEKMRVPSKTLSSGTYTIRVVDHLSDRMVVQIERDGTPLTTFLALPKSTLAKNQSGPITLGSGSKIAMRGFAFSNGTVAEFVYPKAEAVELAKTNNTTIPAVDPASEGRPDVSRLSNIDMQMVTLWLLTPTAVSPDARPGISATRYQAPTEKTSRDGADSRNQQTAQVLAVPRPRPRPAITALPHTASQTPLVALAGIFALVTAGLLCRRRMV